MPFPYEPRQRLTCLKKYLIISVIFQIHKMMILKLSKKKLKLSILKFIWMDFQETVAKELVTVLVIVTVALALLI